MSTPRFLKGPIPYIWLTLAAALPGKALAVGICVWTWAGILRRIDNLPISLSRMPVQRMAASRGLLQLEKTGLVTVVRSPGRRPIVTIVGGQLSQFDHAGNDG
jgi:hypothetical protein